MTIEIPPPVLKGAKALVVGVANQHSIAYGCAKAFRELGAELAITYVNEKTKTYVEPLAKELDAPIFMPLDVATPGMLEAVFDRITKEWGQLDILVHSIAWAPKNDLQGRLLDCSAEGFSQAMDISCHSFVRMARLAAPLMKNGGIHVRDELSRSQQGRAELQRDGPGESGARGMRAVISPTSSAARAYACTRSRLGRSRRARRPRSRTSICC